MRQLEARRFEFLGHAVATELGADLGPDLLALVELDVEIESRDAHGLCDL